MDKLLVSVFDDEAKAFEGLSSLKDLHREGDITLYASVVITKLPDGTVETRQAADRGPLGTLVGLVGGALIGAIGGPVGLAVGTYVGGVGGVFYDLAQSGVGRDFVDEVSMVLGPGKTAVVAQIDENWITPVDTRLGALGATNFRRVPNEFMEDMWTREVEAARAELDQLHTELQQSAADARAKVQARIDATQHKLGQISERITTTIENEQSELDAKVSTLRAQWQTSNERRRTEIEGRIAEIQASYAIRREKLEHARELSKEAHELRKEALVP